ARAVLEPDDEGGARPCRAAVRRRDHQVLVVELLSGLPERLVLIVLERDVDRAVRPDRRNGKLVLVAFAGWAAQLECANRGVGAGNLLRRRPREAAVSPLR